MLSRAAGAYDTLPPTEILERLAGPTRRRRRTRPVDRWSMVLHVAYGAGAGAAFAVLAPGARGRRAVLGPVWGALVWLTSYEGWLPVAGILPAVPGSSGSVADLASRSREFASNDWAESPMMRRGSPLDRNTELLLKAPFDLSRITDAALEKQHLTENARILAYETERGL